MLRHFGINLNRIARCCGVSETASKEETGGESFQRGKDVA